MFTRSTAVLLAAVCVLAACKTNPTEQWVVESVGFAGPRGHGTHYVTCVPAADLALPRGDRERWRDVEISAEQASSDAFDEPGVPCPSGRVLEVVG